MQELGLKRRQAAAWKRIDMDKRKAEKAAEEAAAAPARAAEAKAGDTRTLFS